MFKRIFRFFFRRKRKVLIISTLTYGIDPNAKQCVIPILIRRPMKYGLTSDMQMVYGKEVEHDVIVDRNNKTHHVATTYDNYPDAMSALLFNYRAWTERMAINHRTVLANITAAHLMMP